MSQTLQSSTRLWFSGVVILLSCSARVAPGTSNNDSPLSGGLLTNDSGAASAGGAVGAGGAASSTHSTGASTASAFAVHPLHVPRANLAAASTKDGTIYAIGGAEASWGCSANSTSYAVERMDPSSGEWVIAPNLLTPRCGPAAAASQAGSVFAFGGWDGSAAQTITEELAPGSNSWKASSPMKEARHSAAAALGHDGHIYVFGGFNTQPLSSGEVFDPATGNWGAMPPMTMTRYGHAAAVDGNGLIYAVGGYTTPNSATETVEIYDPSTQSWSPGPRLPEPLYGLAAASSADGHVYVVGGQWCCDNADQVLDVALELSAMGWTNLPQKLPFADFALAAATSNEGRLFAFGGYFAGTLGTVAMYDPGSQAWQSAE